MHRASSDNMMVVWFWCKNRSSVSSKHTLLSVDIRTLSLDWKRDSDGIESNSWNLFVQNGRMAVIIIHFYSLTLFCT